MADHFDLERFLVAQDPVYGVVREELRHGKKTGHWMWFVFPQIHGLGRSAMDQKYSLAGIDEARAYLAHRMLGPRLRECTALVNAVEGRTAEEILGTVDAIKFRSSMTLFARASGDDGGVFGDALRKYYGGEEDALTLGMLEV